MVLTVPIQRFVTRHSSTLVVYADQLLVSGFNFISSFVIARLLGLHGFGIYSIAWMGVLIASSIHQPFIILPLQTLWPKKRGEEKTAYLEALVFQQLIFATLAGFFAFLCVVVVRFTLQGWNINSIILSFPLAVFSFLMQDFFRRYYFAVKKNHIAILIDAVAYCGLLASALSINLFHKLDASMILLLTALFFLYASLIGLYNLPHLRFNFRQVKNTIMENWQFSRWLLATAVLQWFSGNFFIIASGAILGPVAIGATRMAQNLVGITHVLFLAMENTIPAKAASIMRESGGIAMLRYLKHFTLQMGGVVLVILATLILGSGFLISTFYGDEYENYSYMLQGFCLVYIIVFTGYPMRYAIRTLENTRSIFYSFVISSCFSVLAAYPFIRWMGLYGILAGLMITQLIAFCCYCYALRKELPKVLS